MVAYQHFVALSHSSDSTQRCQAAHMVATAFVNHDGPEDEKAALYAGTIGFLDDTSVKVRAALAYGLLHAEYSPHLVMVSLAKDAPVIARAVLQYSPVLLDVDLLTIMKGAGALILQAICDRNSLSDNVMDGLAKAGGRPIIMRLLDRRDIDIPRFLIEKFTSSYKNDAKMRGKLLKRSELPAFCRLKLVEKVQEALKATRIVRGAIVKERLDRLMRDTLDSATTRMGQDEEENQDRTSRFAQTLQQEDLINTRLLLHSLVHGRVLFFARCVAQLSELPLTKVRALLDAGARVGLNALFARCGMTPPLRNLMARLILFARDADLSDDLSARHFVVTALVQELIIEHDGQIPQDLSDAFTYLNEQNLRLAREAVRGVMPEFSRQYPTTKQLPDTTEPQNEHAQLALSPAA